MNLLKSSLKFMFSGGQSNYLQQKMLNFMPKNQETVQIMLTELYARREYIPFLTPTYDLFITNLQKYYARQSIFDRKSLKNYFLIEKMDMMGDGLKRIFHKNITRYLLHQQTALTIKNQRLEQLLWWMYRQNPFQFNKFEQVSNNYTIQLYQLHEYMNSLSKIPAWQPYIRISHMLKVLGHQIQCRQDMFSIQVLQKIDRHYYYYLTELYPRQRYQDFGKKMKIHYHLLEFLCEHYLTGDQVDFDKYLQRLQVIDNIAANEEINKSMDSISWIDLVTGLKLATKAYSEGVLNQIHDHKFSQIFWRKLETSDIPITSITQVVQLLTENPNFFLDRRQGIFLRIMESLFQKRDEQIQFFPVNGYIQLLKQCEFLPLDGASIRKISKFLYQKIEVLLNWQEGDAQEMMSLIQNKEFQNKENIIKHIQKRMSKA